MTLKSILPVILLFGCLFHVGCATMKSPTKWFTTSEPSRVVAFWDAAVKPTGDGTDRGFAGRVYFYDSQSKKPIKIDGTVVIYAFGEDSRLPDNNKPDASFAFSKADVEKVYSKSNIGHSYSFWLPWDKNDEFRKEVAIIVKYFPDEGGAIFSSQATVYLPGKENPQAIAKNEWLQNVEQQWLPDHLRQPVGPISSQSGNGDIRQVGYTDSAGVAAKAAAAKREDESLAMFSERPVTGEGPRPDKMKTRTITVGR